MSNTPPPDSSGLRVFESTGSCPQPPSTGITSVSKAMGFSIATDADLHDTDAERCAHGSTSVPEVGFMAPCSTCSADQLPRLPGFCLYSVAAKTRWDNAESRRVLAARCWLCIAG